MLHFWHISWLDNFKLTFQFNCKARILLILCFKYMNKRWKGVNCIKVDDHNVLTTCSKPSSSSHNVWTKGHTWEQTLTHDRSDWNTCTKSRRLQVLNNYYTLWTLQGWRYCRGLLWKWWETSKSKILSKMQNTFTRTLSVNNIIGHTTECSSLQIQYERSRYQW